MNQHELSWPWMPDIALFRREAQQQLDREHLLALVFQERRVGLSIHHIWQYGEMFPQVMGDLLHRVQPLSFWSGQCVAASVSTLEDAALCHHLWHVQTADVSVCEVLAAHVPSFHVNSWACVRALTQAPSSAVRHVTVTLTDLPASLELAPCEFSLIVQCPHLSPEQRQALARLPVRQLFVDHVDATPDDALIECLQLNDTLCAYQWPGGTWGEVHTQWCQSVWFEHPFHPQLFFPLIQMKHTMRQEWIVWDRRLRRPRRFGERGHKAPLYGRGLQEPKVLTVDPYSGQGWARSEVLDIGEASRVFVGPDARFCVLRSLGRGCPNDVLYEHAWHMHAGERGALLFDVPRVQHAADIFASLVIKEEHALIDWCGSIRVYRLRQHELVCLTADHTLLKEYERLGMPITPEHIAQYQNILAFTLDSPGVDRSSCQLEVDVEPTDRFLLADASLEQTLGLETLRDILTNTTPEDAVDRLERSVLALSDHRVYTPIVVVDADAEVSIAPWFPTDFIVRLVSEAEPAEIHDWFLYRGVEAVPCAHRWANHLKWSLRLSHMADLFAPSIIAQEGDVLRLQWMGRRMMFVWRVDDTGQSSWRPADAYPEHTSEPIAQGMMCFSEDAVDVTPLVAAYESDPDLVLTHSHQMPWNVQLPRFYHWLKLQRAYQRGFLLDRGALAHAASQVSRQMRARFHDGLIHGCRKSYCPLRWQRLQETDNPTQRRCMYCGPVPFVDGRGTNGSHAMRASLEEYGYVPDGEIIAADVQDLYEHPTRFHGKTVAFVGVLQVGFERSSLAGAWWVPTTREDAIDDGTYLVRAQGRWSCDREGYGHMGGSRAQIVATVECIEPLPELTVTPQQMESLTLLMVESEGVVKHGTSQNRWGDFRMIQAGPHDTPRWPRHRRPSERKAKIIGVQLFDAILVYDLTYTEEAAIPVAPKRAQASGNAAGEVVEVIGRLSLGEFWLELDGELLVPPDTPSQDHYIASSSQYPEVLVAWREQLEASGPVLARVVAEVSIVGYRLIAMSIDVLG